MNRRKFLAFSSSIGLTGLAGCTVRANNESERIDGPSVVIKPFATDLNFPTDLEFLPNDDCLICEREGRIFYYSESQEEYTHFLNINDRLVDQIEGETGLLGLELHPEFTDNGQFYLRYSAPRREWMGEDYSHTFVLSEFTSSDSLTSADPDSERIILEIPQPTIAHNAGDLAFSSEGYLYVGVGDGGEIGEDPISSSDSGQSWWYERGQTSQDTETNLLGGILRIDVNQSEEDREYTIPDDNPLVGEDGRDEYFAWGFRNPYRLSFDDNRLFVADVGASNAEEINIVEKGGNYGWPILEGSSCAPPVSLARLIEESWLNVFNPKGWLSTFNLISPYNLCPDPPDMSPRTLPIAEYSVGDTTFRSPGGRVAVIGGYVYQGEKISELQNHYVFGDLFSSVLFSINVEDLDNNGYNLKDINNLAIENREDGIPGSVISFSQDSAGELYITTTQPPYGTEHTGYIFRIKSSGSEI